MSIFSYESRFSQILFRFAYACILGMFWFVSSVPVFTVGAATTALYSVMLKVADNAEGNVIKQYWRAFKENFKQATQIWLILLALGIFLGLDLYILTRLRAATTGAEAILWTIVLAIVIVACIVYAVELVYVFPLIARFENTNRAMMVNALLFGVRYLFATVLVFAIHFAMLVVVVRFFTPALMFSEGICAWLSSYLLSPVLRAATGAPDDEAQDAPEER